MDNLNKLEIILFCSLLLSVVTGCGSHPIGDSNTPVSSPPTTSTTAPLTASSNPRADMIKAMRGSLEAKSYRSRIAIISSSGRNQNITAEFVAPTGCT
jgi:hypothetical protein